MRQNRPQYKEARRPSHWQYSCGICRKDHPLKTCDRFLALEPRERFKAVCDFVYCINCLAVSHTRENCATEHGCAICGDKHHTMLHFSPQLRQLGITNEKAARPQGRYVPTERHDRSVEKPTWPQKRKATSPERATTSQEDARIIAQRTYNAQLKNRVTFAWSKVFIATAQVKIAIPNEPNMWHVCRIGLNFFSPISKIAVSLQSSLKLGTFSFKDARFAKFRMIGRSTRFKFDKEIRAMLTNDLPRKPYERPIEEDPTMEFTQDSLADPDPRCNLQIEIELGAEIFADIYRNDSMPTNVGNVIAQQTAIGYTFTGSIGDTW